VAILLLVFNKARAWMAYGRCIATLDMLL